MNKPWLERYTKGVPAEIDPDRYASLVALFSESCRQFADRPAYANMGRTMDFAELDRLTAALAAAFTQRLGLVKGDRLAIMMPNLLQYPVVLFAALRAGLVVVNCNPMYTSRELNHQLNDSGAEAIVVVENVASELAQCVAETPVEHVVLTQLGDMLGFPKSAIVNFVVKRVKKLVPPFDIAGAHRLGDLLKAGQGLAHTDAALEGSDLAFLQYTGGTTGVSKGAMLTHRNILANLEQVSAWFGDDAEYGKEIVITALPLYHVYALVSNCLNYMKFGGLNVLITDPRDMDGFVKEMAKWPFTAITGVNTLYNALVQHPGFAELDFSTLKLSSAGGMAVQKYTAERWQEITGKFILEGYGLTETSPVATINPTDIDGYTGSIGLPVPSTEVAILDDDGNPQPPDTPGELCVRGPQVMAGYWNRPEATAEVMTEDGFLRTGDIAVMDEHGELKIVDRKKDMVLVSGFNVYPNEIENVATQMDGVLEAACIGVPDEKSGEAVKLFVVREPGATISEDDVKAYCLDNLTRYKVPKFYEFRDDLPKSNVGKILRKDLR